MLLVPETITILFVSFFGNTSNAAIIIIFNLIDAGIGYNDCLSLDNLEAVSINIVPNPTATYFTVQTNAEVTSLTLLEISGRIAREFDINVNQFDVSDLPAGMYIAQVAANDQVFQQRLIIR